MLVLHQRMRLSRSRCQPILAYEFMRSVYASDKPWLPTRRFRNGPWRLTDIAGKGRGVVATTDVEAGKLLMFNCPISYVQGTIGTCPTLEDLQKQMQAERFRPEEAAVISSLCSGSKHPSATSDLNASDLSSMLAALPMKAHLRKKSKATPGALATDASSTVAAQKLGRGKLHYVCMPLQMDTRLLHTLLKYNIFGTESEDRAIAAVQNRQAHSIIGLWPGFSFLNHSCCQNSVCFVTGDRMVVRSAQRLAAGQEVTKNYLGMEGMAPLAVRRKLLEDGYGFWCCCPRCMAEENLSPGTQAMLQDMYTEVSVKLAPLMKHCISHEMETEGLVVLEHLQKMSADLATFLQSLDLPARETVWIQGAFYDLFDALWTGSLWLGVPDEEALRCKLSIVEELAPGSDVHLYSGLEWFVVGWSRSSQVGGERGLKRAQMRGLVMPHRLRYGMRYGTGKLGHVVRRLASVRWGDVKEGFLLTKRIHVAIDDGLLDAVEMMMNLQ